MGIVDDSIKKMKEFEMLGKGSFSNPKTVEKKDYTESENNYNKKNSNSEQIDNDIENRKNMFVPEEPRRSFNDLVINKKTKNQILVALDKIQNHELLYETWGLKQIDPDSQGVAINFFGPPGTGKSFGAEAVASYLGKKLIRISYSEIESKYVGDTPKNIKAAFMKAEESDSVLFFDEADSILGKRLSNVTQSADHSVNLTRSVMLTQLDRFKGIIIFATNFAKNYDEAFRRRILAHVLFSLPDADCRYKLWQFHLPEKLPKGNLNLEELVDKTEGLSGSDIKSCVLISASKAIKSDPKQVEQAFFIEAIEQIKTSSKYVGKNLETNINFEKNEVDFKDLPEDIKKEINNNSNNKE